MTKSAFILLAMALLGGLAAGCGSDDDAGTYTVNGKTYTVRAATDVTTGELPPARFTARANALCREAWVTILDNFTQYSSWQDPELSDADRFAKTVRLSLLAGIDFHIFDAIRLLGGPPGEEEDVEEMIGAMQLAVERGALQRFRSVEQVSEAFAEFNRRARERGLDDCLIDESNLKPIESA